MYEERNTTLIQSDCCESGNLYYQLNHVYCNWLPVLVLSSSNRLGDQKGISTAV